MHAMLRIAFAAFGLFVLLATPVFAAKVTLTGEVTYLERIALPPGGTLSVALVDLAAPAEPRVKAEAPISSPGQVPLTFTLNFDSSVVAEGRQYGLVAEIVGEDRTVWFRNTEPYPVDPLAPGAKIAIVVSIVSEAEAAAPEPPAPPPFLNITWQADSIGGKPVARGLVSSLSIASDMRAGGRGGCNSWFAQAEVNGQRLLFSAVAATRMACMSEAATQQEDAFFGALAATRFWRLDDKLLVLLDGSGASLVVMSRSPF